MTWEGRTPLVGMATSHNLAAERASDARPEGARRPERTDRYMRIAERPSTPQMVPSQRTREGRSSSWQSTGLQNRWLGVQVPPALLSAVLCEGP